MTLRQEIECDQQNICTLCGHRHRLTVHHKVRQRDGGRNNRANLVGLCEPCHRWVDRRTNTNIKACQEYPDYRQAAAAVENHFILLASIEAGTTPKSRSLREYPLDRGASTFRPFESYFRRELGPFEYYSEPPDGDPISS